MNDTILRWAMNLIDRGKMPDALIRLGIRRLCRQRLRELGGADCESRQRAAERFVADMNDSPVAPIPEKANEQHYEVPAAFFTHVLGEHRKYSCCHFGANVTTLDAAEADALRLTCDRAELRDGMRILELGCGWGSLSLWMAQHYPGSRITAVSNSASQRRYIEEQANRRGLDNLEVITCDMNAFEAHGEFDRVVSVEMFEHMRNYRELLRRVSGWLRPAGKLFVHVFCHRDASYAFETEGEANWLGRHFFSGGIMPADDLLPRFQEHLRLTRQWRWSGVHYEKTANAWLANLDAGRDDVMPILAQTYGEANAAMWFQRWRVFFMACAELWGYDRGEQWWVSHYLFENRPAAMREKPTADAPALATVG